MIHRQAAGHHVRRDDGTVLHHGPLADGGNGENRGLGRIDDGGEAIDAVHAHVGDGEGATAVLLAGELPGARPGDQIAHLGGDLHEALPVGLANHRRDEPAFDGDRNGQIHAAKMPDARVAPGGVQGRHALQSDGGHLENQIVERNLRAALFESLSQAEKRIGTAVERHVEVRRPAF